MLGCQLRHAASSLHTNQSLPVAGKQTVDSIRSYSHKQASRNRCRYTGNPRTVVRSDVSVVVTAPNTSSQPTVAAAPGVYYLISAVSSSPCVAILPGNQNPLAPSVGIQSTPNPAGLSTASTGALNDAGDGRESSCFGDDLESLVSDDYAPFGSRNAYAENDHNIMINTVAASENGGAPQQIEAVQSMNG